MEFGELVESVEASSGLKGRHCLHVHFEVSLRICLVRQFPSGISNHAVEAWSFLSLLSFEAIEV